MLLTFLIDIWKVIFLKATFYQKSTFFLSHHFMAHYKSPFWGLILRFKKPIGRYKNEKTRFLTKNEVFNQLAECRNRKLTCINYHLKLRFHTVQANVYRFSDSNGLFGPIVIFPDRSIKLVVTVWFPSSHCKLWQIFDKILSCDKMVTK